MTKNTHTQSLLKTTYGITSEMLEGAMLPTASDILSEKRIYEQARVLGARNTEASPAEIAKEFRYEEGHLYFRIPRPGRSLSRPAGYVRSDGYRAVRLKGQSYLAHRVVWCLCTGNWPTALIDHINGIRDDNRISNLRECTQRENNLNRRVANNDSGVVGVTWAKKECNWRASTPEIPPGVAL